MKSWWMAVVAALVLAGCGGAFPASAQGEATIQVRIEHQAEIGSSSSLPAAGQPCTLPIPESEGIVRVSGPAQIIVRDETDTVIMVKSLTDAESDGSSCVFDAPISVPAARFYSVYFQDILLLTVDASSLPLSEDRIPEVLY